MSAGNLLHAVYVCLQVFRACHASSLFASALAGQTNVVAPSRKLQPTTPAHSVPQQVPPYLELIEARVCKGSLNACDFATGRELNK